MDHQLAKIQEKVYAKCGLKITSLSTEKEGTAYKACSFQLNKKNSICRSGKVTPKKIGQFVTFWKRNTQGITEPFNELDAIDFYIINVCSKNNFGQFVFPKSVLIEKGLISTKKKDGKRGFRVYPEWDTPINKTAIQTQQWQCNYFYKINNAIDFDKVKALYKAR